jgi:hypothetical protein
MTHHDRSKYAAKHPPGTQADERVGHVVAQKLKGGMIACASAHKIAAETGVDPGTVGVAVDLMEARIVTCQLGLFGYGDKKKAANATDHVLAELKTLLVGAAPNNRLTCSEAWRIAENTGLPRLEVANACEALNIKIIRCQLGAF